MEDKLIKWVQKEYKIDSPGIAKMIIKDILDSERDIPTIWDEWGFKTDGYSLDQMQSVCDNIVQRYKLEEL